MICASFQLYPLSAVFLMSLNSACWTLLYLGANEDWKHKAISEIQHLIATYTNTTSSEPIHQRLSAIPMSAWEDEMPVIEGVIRESIRIINNGTVLRRNLVDNLQIGDKTIDKGAFMAYNLADVHMNDMIYSEPLRFDPSRFGAHREEDKQGHAVYLGWGTGRHPCSGQFCYLPVMIFATLAQV
jgi:sterol 14-demethylase